MIDFESDIVNNLFVIGILLILIYGLYRYYMGRPLAGIYEHGIGLLGGKFIPYPIISGIERNRKYAIFGSDMVIVHTWKGYFDGPLDDPHPRLPFWFLGTEGLKGIMTLLARDPTRGHPLRSEPELVIYPMAGQLRR